MKVFIVSVKFLGWIVAIWVRLTRLIRKKRGLRFSNAHACFLHIEEFFFFFFFLITVWQKVKKKSFFVFFFLLLKKIKNKPSKTT